MQRAAIIASARRCLRSYRQNVILVDLGLSDDSGMDFVSEPDQMLPKIDVIIGTSSDEMMRHSFLKSATDSFMPKPFESLIECQQKILGLLPDF